MGDEAGADGSDAKDGDGNTKPTLCANPPCDDGSACAKNSDCVSQHCDQARCVAASCVDNVLNGDETDVDCGGSCAPCAMNKKCAQDSDCADSVCAASNSRCAKPTNSDGKKNGNETGIDCGSSGEGTNTFAKPCDDGGGCINGSDCTSGVCTGEICAAPTCNDRTKNGDETDEDCGGSCGGCAIGLACKSGTDCKDGICTNSKCAGPSSKDKTQNGNETDVDCGSSTPSDIDTGADKCGTGKKCLANVDCASDGCNLTKPDNAGYGVCAAARSCTGDHGGNTCGPNGDEDCCVSLPISAAANAVKLDKYNITAGRYRKFVEYLTALNGGNMRAWLTDPAHMPADWPAYWADMLPIMLDSKNYGWLSNETDLGGNVSQGIKDAEDFRGIYQELGPSLHANDSHYDPFSGNGGCTVRDYGARTYRLPDDINAKFVDGQGKNPDVQQYSQDSLDERSLNCVTAPMLAAFCAWDGGRLAKRSELDAAWGPQQYPWGAATPVGYCYANDTDPMGQAPICSGAYQSGQVSPGDPLTVFYANFNLNYWGNDTYKPFDFSIFVAAPGRFPRGNGPRGHADLGGNLINTTYDSGDCSTGPRGNAVDDYGIPCSIWSKNGSWEGHPIGGDYHRPVRFKYLAMGGRCVHF